ncbi:MAG TPA: aminopeptidase [Gemmatimonadaceae bacterium]|nr:aminopeptidase [Gemmatimonadaceae bacterium]
MRRIVRWAAWGALALVGGLVAFLVVTPMGRYLARAAYEESRILLRRQPLEVIAADSLSPPDVRQRLRLVLDARAHAESALGLRAGESFTTYSRVDHDTLVLVLSVAYRDRLEPVRWWFPVVGRVPYKGFFDFAAAERARADFEQRGFDTYLRPASAFSTLGWFNDPLLSTTLAQGPRSLANTVIHELAHNTLFVRNHVEFNESFASFVGARGAADFFRARGDEESARLVELEWEDDKLLGRFWEALKGSIDSAYAAWPTDSAARVRARDEVYASARRTLVDSVGPILKTVPAARLERVRLDNAALLARRVYAAQLPLFDEIWMRSGRSVRATIDRVTELTRDSDAPFEALRDWLQRP